jgi:integrase
MAKRANGEGTVRQRIDGSWEGRLSYVDHGTDTRKRVSVYGASAAQVRSKLRRVRERIEAGAPAKDATVTVAAWPARWRESSLAASDRKPTTKALYVSLSRKHLEAGEFAAIRLDRLRPTHVEKLVTTLRKTGLSDSTVRQVFGILRLALDVAVRDGLLAANPVAKVKRPGVARREARYLPATDVTRLLDAAEGLRYHRAVALMAATGLRRGEVSGLRWADVDLANGHLTVRHTLSRVGGELVLTEPKTARSRRRVPLSASMVATLRSQRKAQLEDRLKAADQWSDTGMVFATEFGTAVDPRNLLRTVELAAKTAGIEGVGAHTLRHSAAVAWLEAGVHIKAVADLLGHSSIAVTGDVYGHASDETARTAIDQLAAQLGL